MLAEFTGLPIRKRKAFADEQRQEMRETGREGKARFNRGGLSWASGGNGGRTSREHGWRLLSPGSPGQIQPTLKANLILNLDETISRN